jgi:glycosyltransferase involved in cell wall biosynthesis
MPAISVVIPTFNRKNLLIRAVNSVLCQTYKEFEIIIIDDCSDDGTTLLPFSTEDRIRFFRLPCRSGVSSARNFGVAQAGGKWIAFLDSDDEWFPRKLELQLKWMKKNQEFRIVQSKEIWIRNGVRVNPPRTHQKFQGDLFEASLERCMITPSSVFLEKGLFEECGGFDESFQACEDYDLWLRITSKYQIGLLDEFLLTRYGGHQDQLSSTVVNLDRYRIRSMLKLLYQDQLSENQRILVRNCIIKRAEIVANGYYKRGQRELYERFISIADKYR